MGKNPAFQFYPGDWMKDPSLSMCSPSTRGIWMDLLCAIHEFARSGQITGTPDQLARACRCTAAELRAAIEELQSTRTAEIRERNGVVTVTCRRMSRFCHDREKATERKRRQRVTESSNSVSRQCHENVTRPSSSSSSSSSSEEEIIQDETVTEAAEKPEQRKRRKRFVPPTVDEVAAYCRERGNSIDPEAFVAFYEARGWKVKGASVVSWRACVVTWEKNERKFGAGANASASQAKQSGHDAIDRFLEAT